MVIANKGSNGAVAEYEAARQKRLAQQQAEKPTRRTSAGLRDALFDEIDAMRRGDGDPQRAIAVARLASSIINAAKLELDFRRARTPENEKIEPLELGTKEHEPH